jgi:hypothetical protein
MAKTVSNDPNLSANSAKMRFEYKTIELIVDITKGKVI